MDPVMRDVKTPIETERLILKMPEPGDGTVVNAAIQRSVNELKPWLGFVQETPTVEDTESNAREAHAKFLLRQNLRYLVFLKEDMTFVGSTGFHRMDWDVSKFEIGYWMDTAHSGKGYMREAVDALTAYALNDLGGARVEIRCESENKKSRVIPESLGFELEGILRNEDRSVDGKRLTDTCIYAKVCERGE
ncbi:GNAT family N-acetyltransferase [Halobacillus sp. Nhm2S1]|uniref:GNAT family N-acetyltransferase n=1 Tax=Halobacillus sp. Nhm2S1 TaxID=2866716 RepID=UPI001C733CEE|nr:GNAT family N-acetyltransferase [Halobacillus sp. Nhm2S1]MBX0356100.1 GNAT family N-acetyltransferase [Halobacillus sp. Nhm2S1]